MTKEHKITAKETRCFSGSLLVVAEFSDTTEGFWFRLRCGCQTGDWIGQYTSMARLQLKNGRKFILLTQYWGDSVLPTEVPIELVEGVTYANRHKAK